MGQEGSALSGDERAELERLRAENAALRAAARPAGPRALAGGRGHPADRGRVPARPAVGGSDLDPQPGHRRGLESFTHDQVVRVVESDAFADAWVQANRVAHAELVRAFTGESGGAVTVQGDTVTLNLAPIIAVRTRAGLAGAIGWGADRAGLPTGRVGAWVEANKRALRVGAVAAAALALVFWGRPTGKVVLGLTMALLVALALIEFLGRRPAET